ncbi:alpha-amylase family protein [Pedobacter sandarakinus]|uniref:alpha-galactosidase n=1 Tax=Pedobacter sandarakinus TaxID=353156 RepID=UPI00224875A9|nr:alpha-galactosidase [Pedobacter sandarakinus]MCX2574173.1 alpha-galactosidase [Pedobacter sandarakinus]
MKLFFKIKACAFLLFLSVFSNIASAQRISFGSRGIIMVQPAQGAFDVFIGGKKIINEAYSELLIDNHLISTKGLKMSLKVKKTVKDVLGNAAIYDFVGLTPDGLTLTQEIRTYKKLDFFIITLSIVGKNLHTNQMIPLNAELVSDNFDDKRTLFVPFDNDAFIRYHNDVPKLNQKNVSSEATAVYSNDSRIGIVVGTLDHHQWKTGITTQLVSQSALNLSVTCGFTDFKLTRDKIKHGEIMADKISSSRILVGYFNDWRTGMETYAAAVRKTEKPILPDWKGPTPVGWNSWGAMQQKISYEKATQVVDFFADSLKGLRVDNAAYIDLDSYWDNMLKGDDYSTLKRFADYCKLKGLKPGIYWAPFTDWGFQHSANRKAPGSNFTFGEMWTKINQGYHDFDGARALDPTHPGTQQRINFIISNLKKCGFEMIKIDFLGHAAAESTHFYDTSITTGMQAYRVGMEYLLKCIDNKMLIYAAISPSLASGRYVHVRRIACDAFSRINDTEYTLNSVTNGWWQTYLYNYIDADHVVLGNENEATNISRTLSAIVTGTLIVGDDFSTPGPWKNRAKNLFQNQELLTIIKNGKSFTPVEGNAGSGASKLFVKAVGNKRYVALFNYEKQEAKLILDFVRLGIDRSEILKLQDAITEDQVDIKNDLAVTLRPEQAKMFKIILKK